MLTGMAIPGPDLSPTVHQSVQCPEIDILCADHAMLKKALPLMRILRRMVKGIVCGNGAK